LTLDPPLIAGEPPPPVLMMLFVPPTPAFGEAGGTNETCRQPVVRAATPSVTTAIREQPEIGTIECHF
jgi:hypothetical protein